MITHIFLTLSFLFLIAKHELDDILDRLGKLENKGSIMDALTGPTDGTDMSDDKIDLILKAINDVQDKISEDFDKKLENYVQKPEFQDLNDLVQSI